MAFDLEIFALGMLLAAIVAASIVVALEMIGAAVCGAVESLC